MLPGSHDSHRFKGLVGEFESLHPIPLVEGKIAQDGKATAYVCEKRVCQLPTTDPAVFAKQIRQVRPFESAKQAAAPAS